MDNEKPAFQKMDRFGQKDAAGICSKIVAIQTWREVEPLSGSRCHRSLKIS